MTRNGHSRGATANSTTRCFEAPRTGSRRRAVRVPSQATTRLTLGATVWGARLVSLSRTGGALEMERAAPLQAGMAVLCDLPEGSTIAEVRSVRQHPQTEALIVGVSWSDRDAAADAWLARTSMPVHTTAA